MRITLMYMVDAELLNVPCQLNQHQTKVNMNSVIRFVLDMAATSILLCGRGCQKRHSR